MKAFSKDTFFKELNLENLQNSKKEQIWVQFLELVSLEVLDNILDELTEREQEILLTDLAKNPKKAEDFLTKNKKFAPIINKAILKTKKQILKDFKNK